MCQQIREAVVAIRNDLPMKTGTDRVVWSHMLRFIEETNLGSSSATVKIELDVSAELGTDDITQVDQRLTEIGIELLDFMSALFRGLGEVKVRHPNLGEKKITVEFVAKQLANCA